MGYVFGNNAFRSRHDLGHAGFIVTAENGCTVGHNKSSSDQLVKMRELLRSDASSARAEHDLAPVIIFNKTGLDIFTRKIRYGIHMRDKADGRAVFIARSCRDMAVDIAFIIDLCIGYPYLAKLGNEHLCKIKLPCRGRNGAAVIAACGMYRNIIQKSFVCLHKRISFLDFMIHYSMFLR